MPPRPIVDDQTRALWQIGFWRPLDFVIAGVELVTLITCFFWWAFGHPTAMGALLTAIAMIGLLQVWIILLVYRCLFFIVQTRADINLMPAAAAQLAIAYQAGGRPKAE